MRVTPGNFRTRIEHGFCAYCGSSKVKDIGLVEELSDRKFLALKILCENCCREDWVSRLRNKQDKVIAINN